MIPDENASQVIREIAAEILPNVDRIAKQTGRRPNYAIVSDGYAVKMQRAGFCPNFSHLDFGPVWFWAGIDGVAICTHVTVQGFSKFDQIKLVNFGHKLPKESAGPAADRTEEWCWHVERVIGGKWESAGDEFHGLTFAEACNALALFTRHGVRLRLRLLPNCTGGE